jgi:hypothetical protein
VIAFAGTTLHPFDAAIRLEGNDDVFALTFAASTLRINIVARLKFFDNSK